MNWQHFSKSPGRPMPSRQVRYRPNLQRLEDRTLLTSATLLVDPTQSALTISGTVYTPLGNADIQEQAPGSLTTTYEGSIQVDLDLNNQTIQFLNDGGQAFADINGQWQPPDPDGGLDGNYGGQFLLLGPNMTALRNIYFGNTSDVLSLNTSDNVTYTFASVQNITVTAGYLDYQTVFFGSGRTSVAGLSGQNQGDDGSLVDNGDGTFTLTAPVNAQIYYDLGSGAYTILNVTGQLSATGTYDMNSAAVGQSFGHQPANPGGLTGPLSQSASLGSPTLSSPLVSTLSTQAPAQPSSLDHGIAPLAHHGGKAAAVDAAFQDPLQTSL